MNSYVLDLGFVAFQNWLAVAIALIFLMLYVIANIIPACAYLLYGLKERDFWYTPLVLMLMLIPIVGSLFGLHLWNESERMKKFLLLLVYGLVVCVIGLTFTL